MMLSAFVVRNIVVALCIDAVTRHLVMSTSVILPGGQYCYEVVCTYTFLHSMHKNFLFML